MIWVTDNQFIMLLNHYGLSVDGTAGLGWEFLTTQCRRQGHRGGWVILKTHAEGTRGLGVIGRRARYGWEGVSQLLLVLSVLDIYITQLILTI